MLFQKSKAPFLHFSPPLRHASGFTLIELLVVISIIGLLASLIMVSLVGARAKARDARRLSDIRQLGTAMELFYNDRNSYPTTTGVAVGTYGVLSGSATPCVSATNGCINYFAPNYLIKMPVAPTPADGNCGATYLGNFANDYLYGGTGNGVMSVNSYAISFCLGGPSGTFSAGIHTQTPTGIQ